jgi:predicted dehydrogenase
MGLIGLGAIGQVHLYNCLRLRGAKLVAVADRSKKALRIAKAAGVSNVKTDYNELLNDPSIDGVIISLPNFLHCECAVKAAEAGKDIFLEKPLARNITEGKQILSSVEHSGVKLMINYPARFIDAFEKLKNKILTNVLGDIQIASATNVGGGPFYMRGEMGRPAPVPPWWFDKKLVGGGALLDLGIHEINLLRWYFGNVVDAKSYLGYRFNLDLEDHAVCFLTFEDGPIAIITVGWFSRDFRNSVELYGTVRHASVVYSARTGLNFLADIIRRKLGKIDSFQKPYYKALQYFADCINSGSLPSPSGEEALLDLEAVSTAYRNSLRTSR